MPEVSVIMPLYNAERFVNDAVQSILAQSFTDFELIIIDDCSTDGSLEKVLKIKDSRIRIVKNEVNQGISGSRNRGIQEAGGRYIALMDDDDIAPVNRLMLEADFLDAHPDIDVVGGAMNIINEENKVISLNPILMLHNPRRIRAELVYHYVIPNGSAMIRRDFIQSNGLKYADGMMGMEDYHFWIQCSLWGNITNLDDVLLYWRNSVSNESNNRHQNFAEQRRRTLKRIRQFALEGNKFALDEEELDLFARVFCERNEYHANQEELGKLHLVMNKLIRQGRGMEFAGEWEYVCKRMYGIGIANGDIWG